MADALISADEPSTTPANIVALNQQLNTSSRSLKARAEIINPPANLIPGSVVSLTLPSGNSFSAIALPNTAIRYDAFGSFVYVLNKDSEGNYRAARKPVEIVSKEAQLTYILSGIEAGELTATVGSAKLFPNLLTYVHQ